MSDTTIQKTATLHEKTVQKVARGEVHKRKKKRVKSTAPATVAHQYHTKVDPQVVAKAKSIIGTHGYTKMEIVDEATVIVR